MLAQDVYNKQRVPLIKSLKADSLAWVSKYARGGSVRKQSARKMYIALDAIQGHIASAGWVAACVLWSKRQACGEASVWGQDSEDEGGQEVRAADRLAEMCVLVYASRAHAVCALWRMKMDSVALLLCAWCALCYISYPQKPASVPSTCSPAVFAASHASCCKGYSRHAQPHAQGSCHLFAAGWPPSQQQSQRS